MIPLIPSSATARLASFRAPARPQPFLIVGLPRSRTCWLANFLTDGSVRCAHDLCAEEETPAAIARRLLARECAFSGVADTGAVLFLDELLHWMPNARLLVILRPAGEVIAAMVRLGYSDAASAVPLLAERLHAAAKRPRALVMTRRQLETVDGLARLQEHLAPGTSFDSERAKMLIDFNVQLTPEALRKGIEGGAQFQHTEGN